MGAYEGRCERPCSWVGRDRAEEEVYEEGRRAIDADVDKVLVVHPVWASWETGIAFVVQRTGGNTAGRVIEVIEVCTDISGELGGVDVPIDDFRVGVAKGTSEARSFGVVESRAVVRMKGS